MPRRDVQFRLVGELAQELLFIHAVLEGFAAVYEYYGNFVSELAAQVVIGVDVHFLPDKTSAALQLAQGFFDDLAKVAPFTRVHYDLSGGGHWPQFSKLSEC